MELVGLHNCPFVPGAEDRTQGVLDWLRGSEVCTLRHWAIRRAAQGGALPSSGA